MAITKQEEAARGDRAQALLSDPLLLESLAELRKTYFETWLMTEPGDRDGRERLYTAASQLSQVFDHLRSVVGSGRVASQKIERLRAGR